MTTAKGGRPKSTIPHAKVFTWIPVSLKAQVDRECHREGLSVSAFVMEAIERDIKRRRRKDGKDKKPAAGEAG